MRESANISLTDDTIISDEYQGLAVCSPQAGRWDVVYPTSSKGRMAKKSKETSAKLLRQSSRKPENNITGLVQTITKHHPDQDKYTICLETLSAGDTGSWVDEKVVQERVCDLVPER